MSKTYLVIFLVLLAILVGCDQTFLICKGEKVLAGSRNETFNFLGIIPPVEENPQGTGTIIDNPQGIGTVIDNPQGTGTVIDNPQGTGTVIDNPQGTGTVIDNPQGNVTVIPETPVKVEPVQPVKVEPIKVEQPSITNVPQKLAFEITDDYYTPEGQEISDFEVLIDGKVAVKESVIQAGQHSVKIVRSGYQDFQGNIVVPAKNENNVYTLRAKLVSLPRAVAPVVKYDVYPNPTQDQKLGPCQIFLVGATRQEVKAGTMVKPGWYTVVAQRKGYNEFRGKANIIPGVKAIEFPVNFQVKNRVVQTNISYDIQPPAEIADGFIVNFIDFNKVSQTVKPNGTIRPSKYTYEVVHPAYKMEGKPEEIDIQPDDTPFLVEATMIAQPRKITLDTEYNNIIIAPTKVLIDDEEIDSNKAYTPGQHNFKLMFDKFQNVDEDIEIVPGSGTFTVKFNLIPKN